ncbi:hypothetical protein H8356DRAFT_441898 [Neocallimastix lanati (nom. inval.)]|jgi:hypothetical protein|nr:hypothetical protein H8356DRAFT_441898 [Neocallimastix sp. JGI-2020a]
MKISIVSGLLTALCFNLVASSSFLRRIYKPIIYLKEDDLDVSDDCSKKLEPYKKCAEKISSTFSEIRDIVDDLIGICDPTYQSIFNKDSCKSKALEVAEKACKAVEVDECKDFVSNDSIIKVINDGNCIEKEDGQDILISLAVSKAAYNVICSKTSAGKYCPIVQYAIDKGYDEFFNKLDTYVEQIGNVSKNIVQNEDLVGDAKDLITTVIPKDVLVAVGDNCRDNECNNKVLEIIGMAEALKQQASSKLKIDVEKIYPNAYALYNTYAQSYKDMKCSTIDGGEDGERDSASSNKKITLTFAMMLIISVFLLI